MEIEILATVFVGLFAAIMITRRYRSKSKNIGNGGHSDNAPDDGIGKVDMDHIKK